MSSQDTKRFNPQDVTAFLDGMYSENSVTLVAINPSTKAIKAATFEIPKKSRQAMSWAFSGNTRGFNVYFTVNPPKIALSKKPKRDDIPDKISLLHADIDPDDERDTDYLEEVLAPELAEGELLPTAIIGSGNGLNMLIRLKTYLSKDSAERYNRSLATSLNADKAVFNCDRVLRLPGTLNYPSPTKLARGYSSDPVLSKLLFLDTTRQIDQGKLISMFGVGEDARVTADGEGVNTAIEYKPTTMAERNLYNTLIDCHPTYLARINGSKEGLNGSSRSEVDMSLFAIMRHADTTFSYAVDKLVSLDISAGREHFEKGDMRYFYRMWNKVGEKPKNNGVSYKLPTADPVEIQKTIKTGTLLQKEGEQEIILEYPVEGVATTLSESSTVAVQELPQHLKNPPGLVGAVARDFDASSGLSCPSYALASALSVVSSTLGHRRIVMGLRSTGTPLSTYFLTVGRAGAGKGYVLNYLASLLAKGDQLSQAVYPMDARSERALKRGMAQVENGESSGSGLLDGSKPVIASLDEFGLFLSAANSKGASSAADVLKGYLELYGRYNEGIPGTTIYASGSNIEPSKAPYFCINAVGETGSFIESLRGGNIHGGILSRFIYIDPGDDPAERVYIKSPKINISRVLELAIDRRNKALMHLLPMSAATNISRDRKKKIIQGNHHDLLIVRPTPEAKRMLFECASAKAWKSYVPRCNLQDYVLSALYTRFGQHVIEVAGLIAIGCNSGDVIRTRHVRYAINFMEWSYGNLVRRLDSGMAATESHALQNDIIRVLKAYIGGRKDVSTSSRIHGAKSIGTTGCVPVRLLQQAIRPERKYRMQLGSKSFIEVLQLMDNYGDLGLVTLKEKGSKGKEYSYQAVHLIKSMR